MMRLDIIGHLGADAEIKDFSSNQVINFTVAVSETFTRNNEKVTETTWFECQKWGNNTQIAQHLKKGGQVYVTGKPNNRSYINNEGNAVVVNGINVMQIQLL